MVFFSWVWMTASLAIFLNLGLHTTAKGQFILFYFLDLDDSFNINFSGFFLLLLSFLDNWLANPNCIAIRFNFLRWFNFFLYFPICKRGWIWFCGWLVWVFAVLLLGFLCGWFLHLYREEQGRKEKREERRRGSVTIKWGSFSLQIKKDKLYCADSFS